MVTKKSSRSITDLPFIHCLQALVSCDRRKLSWFDLFIYLFIKCTLPATYLHEYWFISSLPFSQDGLFLLILVFFNVFLFFQNAKIATRIR